MQLVIGNKNYSSWSLRPWLGMKVLGIPFEEILVPLRLPDSHANALKYSPTGKVPVLVDGDLVAWDSLAIAEYLAESRPELWPKNRDSRAMARSVCAEMHAGFPLLRSICSMDIRSSKTVVVSTELQAEIDRIVEIWRSCSERFGSDGPYLFGQFSWADAFFAPVVTRLITYGLTVPESAGCYMQTILALPAMQEWSAAAQVEVWDFG